MSSVALPVASKILTHYNGVNIDEHWITSPTQRKNATQIDAVAGLWDEVRAFAAVTDRMVDKRKDAMRQIQEEGVMFARRVSGKAGSLDAYYSLNPIDRNAVWSARELLRRSPRADLEINQLTPSSQALGSDLVPVWRNGDVISVPVNGFPGANQSTFVINVKDSAYGAIGNGMVDDTTAILLAAQAIGNSPFGGVLYFPAGVYLISRTILIPSNCTVQGDGPQFTTLLASNSFVGNATKNSVPGASVCLLGNSLMGEDGTTSSIQQNIIVRNLTLNGNGFVITKPMNNPGGALWLRQVYNYVVENLEIINCSSNGVDIIGTDTSVAWPGNPLPGRISNCHINLNYNPSGTPASTGTFPIIVRGASILLVQGNVTGELTVTHTNDSCDFPGCSDAIICDNKFYNGGDGIGANTAQNAIISNNLINGANGVGVGTYASGGPSDDPEGFTNLTVTGNCIFNLGANPGANPGKTGIYLASSGSSDNSTITGNLITYNVMAQGPTAIANKGNHVTCQGNVMDLGACPNVNQGISNQSGQGGGNYCSFLGNVVKNGYTGVVGYQNVIQNANNITGTQWMNNIADPSITTAWLLAVGGTQANIINGYVKGNSWNGTLPALQFNGGLFPTTGMTLNNIYPYDADAQLVGVTLTGVTVNGKALNITTANNTTPVSFHVPANGAVVMTYSGSASPSITLEFK